MKIGIDCRLINRHQNTGISRYTEYLVEYYLTHFQQGDVYLFTNDYKFSHEFCNIVYTKLKPYNILDFFKFPALVEKLSLDIYHSPFYSGLHRKVDNLINIVTVHDLMYQIVPNFFSSVWLSNYLKKSYFNYIVRKSVLNADELIAVSKTTQADVQSNFQLESTHIPEDSEIASESNDMILSEHLLEFKRFFFYCGNNRPHKNVEFIVRFFNNNLHLPPLVLAGKGHKSSLNVIAVGIVSDMQLNALYRGSTAFIFPSYYEGFGLPVIEALRNNSFVIASKISAFLEFRSDNIFYFSSNSELELSEAVKKAMNETFSPEDSFFEYYSKNRIYGLHDLILNKYKTNK
jgi:glycosyltransferase involved in cell wall biosynthesis